MRILPAVGVGALVAVAGLPILLLEAAGAALLLGATGAWWAPAAAVALLVGARLAAGRRGPRVPGPGISARPPAPRGVVRAAPERLLYAPMGPSRGSSP
jgi:hypothetical protein